MLEYGIQRSHSDYAFELFPQMLVEILIRIFRENTHFFPNDS